MNSPVTIPSRRGPRLWPRKIGWKIVLIGLIVIVLLAAGGFGYGIWTLYRNLPVTQGTLALQGLQGEVTVYRDQNGVPHIEAQNLHDLFVAQGFVTAQARMFQMDLSRRQASGTLSEIVGKATLSQDKFFRTLGLRRWAKKSLPAYSEKAKRILQWYADGVNDYIKRAEKTGTLPVGFRILGYKPEPWTPVDSLTIGKYMAYDLGGHWEGQAFRSYLLKNFPEKKAKALFPSYPDNAPTIIQAVKTSSVNIKNSFAEAVTPNPLNGSNNWVVSGKKTASGKPYLANDPHLGLATPSIWYETNLIAPGINVSGVTFAGAPGIIIGHNQYVAWGVTNVGPDVQDLYIEKRNPHHPNEFLYKGKWYKAKVIHEKIHVKGGKTIPYEVTVTRHGPVVSEFAHHKQPNTALALKWTALQPTTELEAVLKFMSAKNWQDFKTALTYFQAPAQNFVFASKDGMIAYRANGLIPIRKNGDSLLPVPGWRDKYEWTGYIPWDKLPTVVNPKEGFISTANNKVTPDGYPYHISNIWAEPYRAERIRHVLSSKQQFTIQDMKNLQFDHKNLKAKEFLPVLLPELKKADGSLRPIDKKVITMLKNWNRVDNKNLGAPLAFNLWMREIDDVLFDGKIDFQMMDLFKNKTQVTDHLIRKAAKGNPGPWMQEAGGFANVAYKSFKKAVDRAVRLQGDNPEKWQWGKFHKVPFHHPLSAVKPLNLLFDPPSHPVSGSSVTVAAASWNTKTGEVDHGPAWRTIIDMSNPSRSWNVVTPGESGHVLSPWYDDQIEDWVNGRYHVTSTDPDAFQADSRRLVLKPAS
ncbi:MAG TPA: penicillin acylase family protein [Bacillales bacterium]|nr:penicillin acylase family protein [Bacillales bacterium]